jgi:hypothetical protein
MKKLYIIILLVPGFTAYGLQITEDSAAVVQKKNEGSVLVTSRVHTMGLFLYMGRVVNHNPATDLYFNYTTNNGWGFSAFKAVDINDVHSGNNFAFAFISKYFNIGNRFKIAPYFGAGLEQQHGFANHGSDLMFQLLSSFRINKNLSFEHIGIFNNLLFAREHQDWTNRVRILFNNGHWDFIGMLWSNNQAFDSATYSSGGISIFYNRVPISNRLFLGAGLTSLSTFQSSDEDHTPRQTGLQFSTSLTFK